MLAFVTFADAPDLTPSDRLAADELARRGIAVTAHRWDDAAVEWAAYDAVILRSSWDYHRRIGEFRTWLDRLDAVRVSLWNPSPLVRWNVDKRYLRELAARGIPTVPTIFIDPGATATLADVARTFGDDDVVVKPAVSGSAYRTARYNAIDERSEQEFAALRGDGVVLVQPFVTELPRQGEWSLLFFGGEYSHAVLKRPASGDFRVQLEFGGSAQPALPPADLLRQAHDVIACIDGPWLYARVDGCVVNGVFTLIELELIEPVLFLDTTPTAPARFADAVLRIVRTVTP